MVMSGLILTALWLEVRYSCRMLQEYRLGEYVLFVPETEPGYDNDRYWRDVNAVDDYDRAMSITEDYLTRYPHSLDGLLNKAYLLISAGQYEDGILLNQKAVEIHGRNGTAYNNIGWAHVNMGQYELGIHYLEQAIEANGGNATYSELTNLGDAYQGLEQYETAVGYYLQGIEQFPEEAAQTPPDCYIGLAETYQLMEKEDPALEIYQQILEFDPHNYDAFFEVVTVYRERADLDRMLDLGRAYFAEEPEYNYAYSFFASALYELEQYAEAARYYILYAGKTDYPAYGYYQAAKSYARAGDEEQSKKYMELCLLHDPDYMDYLQEEERGESDD